MSGALPLPEPQKPVNGVKIAMGRRSWVAAPGSWVIT